jgi:hypothetical protein
MEIDKIHKTAFQSLINNLTSQNSQAIAHYNSCQHIGDQFEDKGLTPQGIANLVYGYSVKDKPQLFGVTEEQAILMRGYVKKQRFDNNIGELYSQIEKILSSS